MLFAGYRIPIWLAVGSHEVTDFNPRTPLLGVPFEVDRGKERVDKFRDLRNDWKNAAVPVSVLVSAAARHIRGMRYSRATD